MAITPTQWSHVLTIPESYTPSAATSGQTLAITESVIAKLSTGDQATFWSNVQNGGGDVRICTDSGGVNQLPVEVVSLDNVAQTCVIWTRKASYDGTGSLYLFIGKAGETQPPVTDPFGRNAVWSDSLFRSNDGAQTESSNGYAIIDDGSGASVTGLWGEPNGALSSPRQRLSDLSVGDTVGDYTIGGWFNGLGTGTFLSRRDGSSSQFQTGIVAGDLFYLDSAINTYLQSAAPPGWFKVDFVVEGTTQRTYLNGILVDTELNISKASRPSSPLRVGFRGGGGTDYSGLVGVCYVDNRAETQSLLATEYANQNDPASFFGAPTIAATGGTLSIQGASATYSYQSVAATIDLTGSIDIVGATSSYSYQGITANISLTPSINITGKTGAYSYASHNATIELFGLISVTGEGASFQYSAESANVTLQGVNSIVAGTSQYTYLAVNASISLDSGLLITNYSAAYAQDVNRAAFAQQNIKARFL